VCRRPSTPRRRDARRRRERSCHATRATGRRRPLPPPDQSAEPRRGRGRAAAGRWPRSPPRVPPPRSRRSRAFASTSACRPSQESPQRSRTRSPDAAVPRSIPRLPSCGEASPRSSARAGRRPRSRSSCCRAESSSVRPWSTSWPAASAAVASSLFIASRACWNPASTSDPPLSTLSLISSARADVRGMEFTDSTVRFAAWIRRS